MKLNILWIPAFLATKLNEFLLSKTAIYFYIAAIILIVIILVLILMYQESKKAENERNKFNNMTELTNKDTKKDIIDYVDKRMNVLTQMISKNQAVLSEMEKNGIDITGAAVDGTVSTNMNANLHSNGKALYTSSDIETSGENVEVNTTDTRFYMLTKIDKEYETYVPPVYDNKINLRDFCNTFRNYNCYARGLYYDIKDIRRFVAGMAVTKLLILQGMSGTGKTSLAVAFGAFIDNQTTVVPIQPMWKERTDLIGYYNEFTRKFNETTLLNTMYDAANNKEVYITVLDEMNIARVEYYFAEFLSLLELPDANARMLDVVSDEWPTDPKLFVKGKLKLPENMWFIGTANNDDSTFAISDKVYDRAMVLNLDSKAEVFEAPPTKPVKISIDHLEALFKKAEKEYAISDRNLRRIKKLDEFMIETFHITFGNRIMKQIKTYVPVMVACGGSELDAIDDILSRKILRKLESKNPVYVRSQADNLCNYLDDLFGSNKLPLCIETIRRIEQNV